MLEKVKESWAKLSKEDKTVLAKISVAASIAAIILFGEKRYKRGFNTGVTIGASCQRAVVAEELLKGFLDSNDNK